MLKVGVNACTDVTGFGLIGHLNNIMEASGAGAELRLSDIPVIPGAWELLEQGIVPGGTHRNFEGAGQRVRWHQDVSENTRLLLCDAQTSGGLLISVPEDRTDALLKELEAAGIEGARVIGELLLDGKKGIQVVP